LGKRSKGPAGLKNRNLRAHGLSPIPYALRPEIIESAYYLYHFTKDPRYLDMGRTFFNGIVKYCRTDVAYDALSDVEKKTKADRMESFFLAETLKYLYLLFAQPDTLDLTKVVFNTEAHPITRTW
jgi:mannosidase alpha-like ER degradation enhancer 2